MCAVILAAIVSCEPSPSYFGHADNYQLVFENNEAGETLSGSKEALIASVLSGEEIRIYFGDETFGHAADAAFLTVFEGDVFAQLSPIESQRPTAEPKQVLFREPGVKWRSILGTNGFFSAYMDDSDPVIRSRGAKWFAKK